MDKLSKTHQLFLFLVYCHATLDETCMVEFPNLNEFTSSIKKATSFKNLDKPKCIDLILSNQPNCFQHSNIFEIGISNIDVADAEWIFKYFILVLLIWKVSRIQYSAFLIKMSTLKSNIFVKIKLYLWLKKLQNPFCRD